MGRIGSRIRRKKTRRKIKRRLQRAGNSELSAVCTYMLDEEKYVDEWVKYYLFGLKFNRVYIYDNSEHNVLKYLETKYPGVKIIHSGLTPVPPGQPRGMRAIPAMNDFLNKNKELPEAERVKWCAFIQADEFLVLKKHDNINDFLKQYCQEGGVAINWYLYGDSNLKTYTPEPVTKRFLLREENTNAHIRTICNCEDVIHVKDGDETHGLRYFKQGKNLKDTNGKVVVGPFNPNGPTDVAFIAHYFTKTKEEWDKKVSRGQADGLYRTGNEFDSHNMNEIKDDSAAIIYDKAVAAYNDYLKRIEPTRGSVPSST